MHCRGESRRLSAEWNAQLFLNPQGEAPGLNIQSRGRYIAICLVNLVGSAGALRDIFGLRLGDAQVSQGPATAPVAPLRKNLLLKPLMGLTARIKSVTFDFESALTPDRHAGPVPTDWAKTWFQGISLQTARVFQNRGGCAPAIGFF